MMDNDEIRMTNDDTEAPLSSVVISARRLLKDPEGDVSPHRFTELGVFSKESLLGGSAFALERGVAFLHRIRGGCFTPGPGQRLRQERQKERSQREQERDDTHLAIHGIGDG